MRLRINQPQLAAELVSALNATDCFAARTGGDQIDVYVPWVADGEDARRAETELVFFVGAWAAGHPDCRVKLVNG